MTWVGRTVGVTRLPLRLYWSGPAPRQVEWDLSRQSRRARLYELAWQPLIDTARRAA